MEKHFNLRLERLRETLFSGDNWFFIRSSGTLPVSLITWLVNELSDNLYFLVGIPSRSDLSTSGDS